MDSIEWFVRLCGEVGNYTESVTGVSIVDAYTGPKDLAPQKQSKDKAPDEIIHDLTSLMDTISKQIEQPTRRDYLLGEIKSLIMAVQWLSSEEVAYSDLVQSLFHIPMTEFSEKEINTARNIVDEVTHDFPGDDLRDRVERFGKEGEITGEPLKELIEGKLQSQAREVGMMFRDNVYSVMGQQVTDNGVEYRCVTDKPWSGYNWYQGGYKSLNEFNVDRTFNRDSIMGVIYHEYEHHVSNLWREKYYLETGNLELSIVPLHTGSCVISEGSADTAKEFLGVTEDNPRARVVEALYTLRRMTGINAAIMLNHKGSSIDEAVEYMIERGLSTKKASKASISFISSTQKNGRPNLFAPYVFTYYFGRTDFVLPTFNRAVEQNELARFYQTLYLNPYSRSSVTWKKAFDWL